MLTQEEVREKFIKRLEREKQTYIAKQINIPRQILSEFKHGKKNLYPESLKALNDYLDNH